VYVDDDNMLGERLHTLKNNSESPVFTNNGNGLEVNVDNSKYMFMLLDQNTGRSHNK
jgi:hypothetical protein